MNDILFSAFLLSVVLLGINSYFGLEIIRRGIIFTDLAIGQMAALELPYPCFCSTATSCTPFRWPSLWAPVC